jgi:hypothetical protein
MDWLLTYLIYLTRLCLDGIEGGFGGLVGCVRGGGMRLVLMLRGWGVLTRTLGTGLVVFAFEID